MAPLPSGQTFVGHKRPAAAPGRAPASPRKRAMMGEKDRLRPLQMSVAGDDDIGVFFRQSDQGRLQPCTSRRSREISSRSQRRRSRAIWSLRDRPVCNFAPRERVRQRRLDVHVNVLEFFAPRKLAGHNFPRDSFQPLSMARSSAAVRIPICLSIAAWASEPRMSCSHNRQSNETDWVNLATSSCGRRRSGRCARLERIVSSEGPSLTRVRAKVTLHLCPKKTPTDELAGRKQPTPFSFRSSSRESLASPSYLTVKCPTTTFSTLERWLRVEKRSGGVVGECHLHGIDASRTIRENQQHDFGSDLGEGIASRSAMWEVLMEV